MIDRTALDVEEPLTCILCTATFIHFSETENGCEVNGFLDCVQPGTELCKFMLKKQDQRYEMNLFCIIQIIKMTVLTACKSKHAIPTNSVKLV